MLNVVAVSGGMDSTCLLAHVQSQSQSPILAISVIYGQRHAIELDYAKRITHVDHLDLDLTPITALFGKETGSLIGGGQIEQGVKYGEIKGLPSTYVPNRNTLIANALAAIGRSRDECGRVWIGIHADDNNPNGGAYPDCTPEWAKMTSNSIKLGTGGGWSLCAPFVRMNKGEVAKAGLAAGLTPMQIRQTYSCYAGHTKQCGKCPTCLDKIGALVEAGIYTNPAEIAEDFDLSTEEAKLYI